MHGILSVLVGLALSTQPAARPQLIPGATPAERPSAAPEIQTQTQTQTPPPTQKPPPTQPPADTTYRETVVVSASKTEQKLVDAPATMTVIGAAALQVAPSGNYADLLRAVPGLNITQISARDVNVTSRGASGSLATSQLAVVDGRSIYQDFFGFTMWDFMPANLDEIKQIEAIRGPASAVWGANALNGVINVITKSPREMQGQSLTIGLGTIGREVNKNGADSGTLFYVRGTHAAAVDDRWAYKISAGTFSSDALARPTGPIPGGGTNYPNFTNTGTTQPKFDARVDYDFPDGTRKLQFSGGVAQTDGVMHTGIGPFDISNGATMGYWKVNFLRGAMRVQAFMNFLNGDATNLVSVDTSGRPTTLAFTTKTFDLELGDTRIVRSKNVVTYGANLRLNRFDLDIAPGENSRTEGGVYVQDEVIFSEQVRLVAGARVDKFSSIDSAVFSPRVALVLKPRGDQSVRVSYNRAFRAPSMVNNNLDITLATPLPLGLFHPAYGSAVYLLPTEAIGNSSLTEERIDTFEVAYTGNLGSRALVSAAVYYNDFSDQIFFTQSAAYGISPPPPGFPSIPGLPGSNALVWGGAYLPPNNRRFPSQFTYLNLGTVKSKGIELGLDGRIRDDVTGFINYSFQADPVPEFPGLTAAQAIAEINRPAQHLFNIGATYSGPRAFGTFSVSHSTDAFWQDVLDSRFHGTTKAYTLANLTAGARFQGGRYAVSLKVTNVGNQQVQQHIFGDVMRRTVVVELRIRR